MRSLLIRIYDSKEISKHHPEKCPTLVNDNGQWTFPITGSEIVLMDPLKTLSLSKVRGIWYHIDQFRAKLLKIQPNLLKIRGKTVAAP